MPGSAIPGSRISKIERFHRAVVIVTAIGLRVAVVEAATCIEVLSVDDPVFSFRLIVDCCALRIIMAQAHSRLNESAVDLMAHDGDWSHVGDGKVVGSAQSRAAETTARRLREVVVLRRLIVDRGDPAVRIRAKVILAAASAYPPGSARGEVTGWITPICSVLPSD